MGTNRGPKLDFFVSEIISELDEKRETKDVEVNIFVRRPYIVWEESNLYKVKLASNSLLNENIHIQV